MFVGVEFALGGIASLLGDRSAPFIGPGVSSSLNDAEDCRRALCAIAELRACAITIDEISCAACRLRSIGAIALIQVDPFLQCHRLRSDISVRCVASRTAVKWIVKVVGAMD